MATISFVEFHQAAINWDKYHGRRPSWPNYGEGYHEFLGFNALTAAWHNYDTKTIVVPDHAVNKLRWLASPHFRTIIKIYYAKKDEELCIS